MTLGAREGRGMTKDGQGQECGQCTEASLTNITSNDNNHISSIIGM